MPIRLPTKLKATAIASAAASVRGNVMAASGVGWALEYVLIDKTGKHSLADLRTLQDWQVQYQIRAVPGVAEVASVGGFVKQYQVTIDPNRLLAYKIPINRVVEQIRAAIRKWADGYW